MFADLLMHMGINLMDTIAGTGYAPSIVLLATLGLPDYAHFRSTASGSPEFSGWGKDRMMLADIYDAIRENTVVTAGLKENFDKFAYPRPGVEREQPKKEVTLSDLFRRLDGARGAR